MRSVPAAVRLHCSCLLTVCTCVYRCVGACVFFLATGACGRAVERRSHPLSLYLYPFLSLSPLLFFLVPARKHQENTAVPSSPREGD